MEDNYGWVDLEISLLKEKGFKEESNINIIDNTITISENGFIVYEAILLKEYIENNQYNDAGCRKYIIVLDNKVLEISEPWEYSPVGIFFGPLEIKELYSFNN